VDEKHHFTLVCRDLSEIATYARIDNQAYRLLKTLTPGPYTFLYQATKQVPRRLQNAKRKAIGIRVPDNVIVQALLAELNEALMSTTLILPGDEEPTTVVDMTGENPEVVRVGKGDAGLFGADGG
jgi:tRNA threonylcarbamoyl adenosine modification protein (Sua5/YciO/YrdC/YwlC family)